MRPGEKTTAIITGNARGIGKGVNVVICPRTKSEVNSPDDEIKKQSSQVNLVESLALEVDAYNIKSHDDR